MQNGRIAAVGKRGQVAVPKSVQVIDCTGKVIVAGFWNSHVHFETGWQDAPLAPSDQLKTHMEEMLTRWGFTTVWDLGSDPTDSLPLRARVNAGNVAGPNILLAGNMYPKGGHPRSESVV